MDDLSLYLFSRLQELLQKEVKLFFSQGVFGFTQYHYFSLREKEGVEPYFFLECLDEELRFIVCDPFHFFPSYNPAIGRPDLNALNSQEGATLILLSLVNVKKAPPELNLRAPLLIDWDRKKGRQIIVGLEG